MGKSKLSKKQKQDLDQFIGYAVKEGCLDVDKAKEMSYKDKQDYLDWSDSQVETKEHSLTPFTDVMKKVQGK